MADEGNASRGSSINLNLCLALPRSPPPRIPDLGSDLSLNSLPMPAAASEVNDGGNLSETATVVSEAEVHSQPHPPHSPTSSALPHPPHSPNSSALSRAVPAGVVLPPIDSAAGHSPEYDPYSPSYEGFDVPFAPAPHTLNVPGAIEAGSLGRPHEDSLEGILAAANDHMDLSTVNHVPYSPPYVTLVSTHVAPCQRHLSGDYMDEDSMPSQQNVTAGMTDSDSWFQRSVTGNENGSSSRHPPSVPYGTSYEMPRIRRSRRGQLRTTLSPTALGIVEQSARVILEQSSQDLGLQQPVEDRGSEKALVASPVVGALEEEEDKSKNAANFECNICFEMADEPVVTSCGHLFCWPCLFRWLHVHSHHKECPVCKGEVTEANITPIYGRGTSKSTEGKNITEGETIVKIPPRPHGNRLESFRQHFRPISRRLGEGFASSWRRLVDYQMRREGLSETFRDIYDRNNPRPLTRFRARRLSREQPANGGATIVNNGAGMPSSSGLNVPSSSANSILGDGLEFLQEFSVYGLESTERLAALTADLNRVVGEFASIGNQHVGSTSSSNPPVNEAPTRELRVGTPTFAADQASASSTMAMIQGGETSMSECPAEPSNAGSSRHLRRGRGGSSSTLDTDGCGLHGRKRRRTN